jgi:hypothetical protein
MTVFPIRLTNHVAVTATAMTRGQVVRIRWAVRGVMVLGVAASMGANILHAESQPIARVIAAWPPLALLLTVEVIGRVPVHRRVSAVVRIVATTGIALIAVWVSYWHMVAVAIRYGESGAGPYLLPLSVDGMVVVASISLVELSGRLRALKTVEPSEPSLPPTPSAMPEPTTPVTYAPIPQVPAVAPNAAKADGAASKSASPAETPVHNDEKASPHLQEVPAGTKEAVQFWHAQGLEPEDIAIKVNRSLRTVYRHVPKLEPDAAESA